jgi:hypothetical protein
MLTNAVSKIKRTLGQGVLSPVWKIYLRGVDFDSQLVSCQHSEEEWRNGWWIITLLL